MKASELESRDQGPTACAKSCEDIQMRMVAMVLVSNDLPGCVCQVLEQQRAATPGAAAVGAEGPPAGAAPAPAVAPASEPESLRPSPSDLARDGAAASTAGFVVIAAAAAARQQQQRRQQEQSQQKK